MISITSCDCKSSKEKYVRFVYDLYQDDPSFVGTSVFELKTYLFQKSRHAREVYTDAILVENEGEIKVACMFFFSREMPLLQIGFFEAKEQAQSEVDAVLTYAAKKAKLLGAKKIVIGLNAHISVGVGMLNFKFGEGSIAFDSIYSKLYYPGYFRKNGLTESTLSSYKGNTDDVLNLINNRSIEYEDIQLRPMNKRNFQNEIEMMTKISNDALKGTELFYNIGENDLYHRLKKIKFFLRPHDLMFVLKNGKEIGYLFTHPDFNQALTPGKKLGKLNLAFRILTGRKKIDTLKVNSVCMTEKRSIGLQHLIKTCTSLAKNDGHKFLESNFIFDSNKLSALFALRQGYSKYNTYSIFYMEVEDA